MALIQNINTSTPNDNLGDTLRVGFVKANENFTELNNKKVEVAAGKGLSTNDYTDLEKTKLSGIETGSQKNVQANWNQTDDTQDDYIIGKPIDGKILVYGTYELVGETLTINSGWTWQIGNTIYTNASPIVLNIPYSSAGLQRLDLIVFNTSNSAERVEGDEVVSDPVTPIVIDNSVLFAVAYVSDSDVSLSAITLSNLLEVFDGIIGVTSGLTVGQQAFELPIGAICERVYINGALQYKTTTNNTSLLNRWSQTDNIITITKTTVLNNYIYIEYKI